MRLSSALRVSSLKGRDANLSGPRLRKKHKRLDAICEEEYNRYHGETNEGNDGAGSADLRRSSRVRRAPVLLDVSPQPAKKRQKIRENVVLGSEKSVKHSSPCGSGDLGRVETPGSWNSRLRSRGKKVATGVKQERGSPSGKRKLFKEMSEIGVEEKVVRGELGEKKGELGSGKSKRPRRIKAVINLSEGEKENVLSEGEKENELSEGEEDNELSEGEEENELGEGERENNLSEGEKENELSEGEKENELSEEEKENNLSEGEKEIELSGVKEENEREEVEVIGDKGEDGGLVLESAMGGANDRHMVDGNAVELVDEEERGRSYGLRLEEGCVGNDNVETMELSDKEVEQLECGKEGENSNDVVEVVGILTNQVEEDGGHHDGKDADLAKVDDKPLEDENAPKVDKAKCALSDTHGKLRVKEGRRCGLCGGRTDGKPPKRLIQDTGESENEAYSGSSGSDEPNYDLWDGFGDEPGWLGRLLGPVNDRYGIAGIWVHQHCAVWSPEVWFLTCFLIISWFA
jgi:hypothetical protein